MIFRLPHRTFLFAGLVILLMSASSVAAQDNFDGAVWRFKMSNKQEPSKVLVGNFRVSDHVLFQKENPSDSAYSKKVGTNKPNGKATRFDVSDFRTFTEAKRKLFLIKGTARVSLVEFGEWHGLFTDGRGVNWAIKLSRIQE